MHRYDLNTQTSNFERKNKGHIIRTFWPLNQTNMLGYKTNIFNQIMNIHVRITNHQINSDLWVFNKEELKCWCIVNMYIYTDCHKSFGKMSRTKVVRKGHVFIPDSKYLPLVKKVSMHGFMIELQYILISSMCVGSSTQ